MDNGREQHYLVKTHAPVSMGVHLWFESSILHCNSLIFKLMHFIWYKHPKGPWKKKGSLLLGLWVNLHYFKHCFFPQSFCLQFWRLYCIEGQPVYKTSRSNLTCTLDILWDDNWTSHVRKIKGKWNLRFPIAALLQGVNSQFCPQNSSTTLVRPRQNRVILRELFQIPH